MLARRGGLGLAPSRAVAAMLLLALLGEVGPAAAAGRKTNAQLQREHQLRLAAGMSNPDKRTGPQSVYKQTKQWAAQTGSVTKGVQASPRETKRAVDQASVMNTRGLKEPDRRSGHVNYGSGADAFTPLRREKEQKRYAHSAEFTTTHVLFAFLIVGIIVTAALRIFHNYQKENDWVTEMQMRGALTESMDKTRWRSFIKALGGVA